jgi:hypothetical protein
MVQIHIHEAKPTLDSDENYELYLQMFFHDIVKLY